MPATRERRGRSDESEGSDGRDKKRRKLVLSVSNLSRNVNQEHLKEIFGNYGKVKDATLAIDKVVGLPKGYAYVEFSSEREADSAVSHLHGGQIDGNVIKVEWQDQRKKQPARVARGRGRLSQP
ncbi:unnamed protein product, partial [Prorocentrum cordatum]